MDFSNYVYRVSVKPRIDRTNLKSVIIKAGRTHKWNVDISGEPPPEVKWIWRDNIPLTNTERIKIENVDYHTDFTIVNAMRKDTGKYTIIAENSNGKDEETVELTVLGKFRNFFLSNLNAQLARNYSLNIFHSIFRKTRLAKGPAGGDGRNRHVG